MKTNTSKSMGNLTGKGSDDFLVGTGLEGMILGGGGNDVLVGTTGSDAFRGGGHDDLFIGNGGGDQVFGNGGYDIFQVPGSVLNYSVWQQGPQHWKVHDLLNDATSTLRHVEQIDFDGYSIVLTGEDNTPYAENFMVDAFEDVTFEGMLSDHSWDLEGPLTYNLASVGTAQGGTVVVGGDGSWSYLSPLNFHGVDSFDYTVWDGIAGHDVTRTVTINVAAVADTPTLSVTTGTTGVVNEVALDVSAALTDVDGSESLSLHFSAVDAFGDPYDLVANGVQIMDGTVDVTAGGIVDPDALENLVLVLPEGVDSFFDLTVTAQSTEASNGDTAETSEMVDIVYDYEPWHGAVRFQAINQSMWQQGDAYVMEDENFYGIDVGYDDGWGPFKWGAGLKSGIQTDISFNGGSVYADLPYELHFDSSYNETVDHMLIETAALAQPNGGFQTFSPNGHFDLDLVFDSYAYVGLDLAVWTPDLGFWFPFWTSDPLVIDLFYMDSEGAHEYQDVNGMVTADEWPTIETISTAVGGGYYSEGSADIFHLNADVDDAVTSLLGLPFNPVDWYDEVNIDLVLVKGGFWVDAMILDYVVDTGIRFDQSFDLQVENLTGRLKLEDGTAFDFTYGDAIDIPYATSHDVDGDGVIQFSADADPSAVFTNDTDLVPFYGHDIDLLALQVGAWYWTPVANGEWQWPEGDPTPLWSSELPTQDLTINLYDQTFEFDFMPETVYFMV